MYIKRAGILVLFAFLSSIFVYSVNTGFSISGAYSLFLTIILLVFFAIQKRIICFLQDKYRVRVGYFNIFIFNAFFIVKCS